MERKFIRDLSLVGHIEDISVDKGVQGKRLGFRVVTALAEISENLGAYRTILDCHEDNVPFYVKCGFKLEEREMIALTASEDAKPKGTRQLVKQPPPKASKQQMKNAPGKGAR
ncbi:hypothetical protein FRC00_011229 [Tulasnella sp. 408]|nr:hypothetical protein FRC00_011229 [Tulasnella sp. 408]